MGQSTRGTAILLTAQTVQSIRRTAILLTAQTEQPISDTDMQYKILMFVLVMTVLFTSLIFTKAAVAEEGEAITGLALYEYSKDTEILLTVWMGQPISTTVTPLTALTGQPLSDFAA